MSTKKHRQPLDAVPADPGALAELRAGTTDPTDDEAAPDSGPVARELDPGPQVRDAMPSVPFELTETPPLPLAAPRQRMPSEPIHLVRVSSRPPPALRSSHRVGWGVMLVALVLFAAAAVWLASSGLLE